MLISGEKHLKGIKHPKGQPLAQALSFSAPSRFNLLAGLQKPSRYSGLRLGKVSSLGAHAGILLSHLLARITCRPRTTPLLPTCFPVQVIRRKSVPDRQTDSSPPPHGASQRKSPAPRTLIRGGRQLRVELQFKPVPVQAPGLSGGGSRETTPRCLQCTVARHPVTPGYSRQWPHQRDMPVPYKCS